MGVEEYRFLDIGGGPNWSSGLPVNDQLKNTMRGLRAVQLARQNPHGQYFVLDADFPFQDSAELEFEFSNLHLNKQTIELGKRLIFEDESFNRAEMNFMWTPLSVVAQGNWIRGYNDPHLYLHAFKEAVRILKKGGVIAITEKLERLDRIRRLVTPLLPDLGLALVSTTEVLDLAHSAFADRALFERTIPKEQGGPATPQEADLLRVYTLELQKQ